MENKNKLYESSEDYLERILMLHIKNEKVKAIDIASSMGFSKASVSIALKKLKANGLVKVSKDGDVGLTEDGLRVAQKIYERHRVLGEALMKLGVSEETAYHDACKVEHDISEETFQAIKNHFLDH